MPAVPAAEQTSAREQHSATRSGESVLILIVEANSGANRNSLMLDQLIGAFRRLFARTQ
jgi:hypothetical protein